MDKNKNRTDLLAAGRKKLQQYRQKKDGKGSSSHGKTSKKSSKSDRHDSEVDEVSNLTTSTALSQVPEVEIMLPLDSDLEASDSSVSHPVEKLVASDVSTEAIDQSTTPMLPETELANNANEDKEVGFHENAIDSLEPNNKESVHVSVSPTMVDSPDGTIVTVEVESINKEIEESLPSKEDTPDVSLIYARGDQVMDEADGLDWKQHGDNRVIELEEDSKVSASEPGENAGTAERQASEHIDTEGIASQVIQNDGAGSESASTGAMNIVEGLLTSGLSRPEADETLGVVDEVANQAGDAIDAAPANIEKSEMLPRTGQHEEGEECSQADNIAGAYEQQYMTEESFVFVGESHEEPLLTKSTNLYDVCTTSPRGDATPISFLQLVEAIKVISEDEYRLLLTSRESTRSVISSQHDVPVLVEKLNEELFVASCQKDILLMQLSEQSNLQTEYDHRFQQLDDQIGVLHASLNEARHKCDYLAEELAESRSELEVIISRKEELQVQLHAAKVEVEDVYAREIELQNCLERSQLDLLSLSKESAESKGLIGALHVENESLKQTISLLTEETKKVAEEKTACFYENEKLFMDLAECKNLVAALRAESSCLSETLASSAEKCKKLEEEKEHLADGNEKLTLELSDCKGAMEALQLENDNIRGDLAMTMEERKKLEKEKENSDYEMQRLSSELLVLHERLPNVQVECRQLKVELKEATMHLEPLIEENIFLEVSLQLCKAYMTEVDNRHAQRSLKVEGEPPNQIESLGQSRGCENDAVHEQSQLMPGQQDAKATISMLEKSTSDSLSGCKPSELEVPNTSVFVIMKRRLEEAERVLEKLEKAIEGINLSKSDVKMSASAVSRLINAFESKTHHDEPEAEKTGITEDRSPAADPLASIREHMEDLKGVLKQLTSDAVNASLSFKAEQEIRSADNLTMELKFQLEAMEEHTLNLEAANVELEVLYEAVKQHVFDVNEKNKKVEDLYETLKQEDNHLKADNDELGVKLSVCEERVTELQTQLGDLQKSSDQLVSGLNSQLDTFQKEASDRALTVEQEWNSTISQIIKAVQRLDSATGFLASSTIAAGGDSSINVSNNTTASIDAAIKIIGELKEKLEVVSSDHEATVNLYEELNEKQSDLLRRDELTSGTLHMLYSDLRKLVMGSCGSVGEFEVGLQDVEWSDPIDYSRYRSLVEQLENFLAERLQLHSVNHELSLELTSRTKDFEEVNRRCVDLSSIEKLIELVEGVVKLEDPDLDGMPISRLEVLVSTLVHKYRKAEEKVVYSKEEFGSKVEELIKLQEEIHPLSALKIQHETEICLLNERLSQVEPVLSSMQHELQDKVTELEQSEQRVSSIREKLSIAVAKGKGLVVQRDGLKQSLSETSSELERCSQELQLKDARLHELETKLKTYSEAGERVEALESELSYIRNSATALRESFLLKDSVLQRIEEILEDLDLPEHFHSRGIIEKVDWLARSATGNSLPPADWEQKSPVGGSYSDTGFAVMDAWKEDAQPGSNSDDLRRKYEDLQGKFYGLAEQNEMLEQSLMERNQLVQRWEELLDRINMPGHLRSAEPEDRIEWIGNALSEAHNDRDTLLQNIDKLENYCGLVTADLEQYQDRASYLKAELEESRRRISDLEMAVQAVTQEREELSERLKILSCDHEDLSMKAAQVGRDNAKLHNELTDLDDKLVQNEEHVQRINDRICRMQDLVCDALKDPSMKNLMSGGDSVECLEGLLEKLIENYMSLSPLKPVLQDAAEEHHAKEADDNSNEGRTRDIMDDSEFNFAVLKRETALSDDKNVDTVKTELEETLTELIHVKEERDRYLEKQQTLVREIEALERKAVEFQELLQQEEQKSASLREKLNVAVRKGKSLVQHRDSLKQIIEEMSTELERLKSNIKHRESTIADYELKMRDLITYSERVEVLESESLMMKNHLAEVGQALHEKEHALSIILNSIGEIDVGGEIYHSDPIKKLEHIGKSCNEFHAAFASCEEESRKSRRAAELLLAELNEVQDRNDSLQEELAKATAELTHLHKDRDVIEAEKFVALSRLEKMSLVHAEEQKKRNSELLSLKSAADQLTKSYSYMNDLLANVFSKDLEFLQNLESSMNLCLERREADHLAHVPLSSTSDSIISWDLENKESFMAEEFSSEIDMPYHFEDDFTTGVYSSLQDFKKEIGAIKVTLREHLVMYQKQASNLLKLMGLIHGDMASQKESFEALKRDAKHKDTVEKEKEMEIVSLRRNMGLLYEACSCSLMEIDNRKAADMEVLTVEDQGLNLKPPTFRDGISFVGQNFSSEEDVKNLAEKLLSAVKSLSTLKGEMAESDRKEMKITILNLQKELQEKDIQRERICKDLVSQIKQAEATATSYSQDLQSTKSRVHDLEKRVEMVEDERNLLERRVKELQDQQTISTGLEEKIRSLTDVLSSKDQEIESLMQALDEEEVQMEDLTKRIEELEKVVLQKNLDIENLETSRGKALKKLSITVSKFDELHHFSESLLAEVEKLQSQLQDRDGEISFLRQEVTRSTNDALTASQMSNKRNSDEIYEFFAWLGTLISLDVKFEESTGIEEWRDIIQRKITSIFSELTDLRAATQTGDALLQIERSKIDELTRREESLVKSLHEKEAQLNMLGVDGDLSMSTSANSEIVEVEPVINKWTVPGASTTSQVRSLRKANNDQVAIAIDMGPVGTSKLEDEDDEKVHGFKSLTSSRIVPKFTRPLTDMVDGLWVSCDRALMRQPGLRLGIMIYWAVLHALLAAFVV
ncbi:trans-Golgi network-localized SYP41-interacting protein 1 isoform X2 [Euphorbia lathyris]|uniref:trans-Golgi network-localized SYP41-interacting protein 1 isoform X2 n=1 Tax=Euphorbia lathyris TaxID=212925 RepID=UPI0033134A4F